MIRNAEVTSAGIKKILKNYKPATAISEYIWNGFDAKATIVNINYTVNELGRIESLTISDNGKGIDFSNLPENFDKFYDSEKTVEIESPKNTSIMHGKNGVGRLTFFTFANNACWATCYKNSENVLNHGKLTINASSLKNYHADEIVLDWNTTGTSVTFTNLIITNSALEYEVLPFLNREFAWFLELNKANNYKIIINGIAIDYQRMIIERDEFTIAEGAHKFSVKFIHWSNPLNKEYSKFYFLKDNGDEVYKDYTTLNRKGDQFYHSVYIDSSFFNDFDFKTQQDSNQMDLFSKAKSSAEYKNVIREITNYLRSKRKPFLRQYAELLVVEYEQNGIFPQFRNSWEEARKDELKEIIIGLYEVQPKVFVNLNIEQKKTFVRFLNLLLDSNEKESIFSIIEEVTNLDAEERKELSDILKKTKLNRIISTIKLVEDRFKVYYSLKQLVFNDAMNANEVHHLQTMIENHYWLFGEQYHLVTAAEPKFTEALRRYIYLLRGEKSQTEVDHLYKQKEMDIFMCRQEKLVDRIHNVVIELKHPTVKLGEDQLMQVKRYMNVIVSEPEFNGANMSWDFILVGREFNHRNEIEMAIESAAANGERSLVFKAKNFKIYVKKWSEIFNEFELRHNFIDEKLKLERQYLAIEYKPANEAVHNSLTNTAAGNGQVTIPTGKA